MKRPLLVAAMFMSGCALHPAHEVAANKAAAIASIPRCSSEKECEVKWAAARSWILKNAGWKIKLITNDYIETHSPVGGSTNIGVRVAKEAQNDGTYIINAAIWCDNMWGCIPDSWAALASMHNAINSSWTQK